MLRIFTFFSRLLITLALITVSASNMAATHSTQSNTEIQLAQLQLLANGDIHSQSVTPAIPLSHQMKAAVKIHRATVSKPPLLRSKPKPAASRLWNLRDADIRSVISAVSHETGKNFIVDPRVTGKVSIISSTPINARELYQVFLSVLQVSGFAAIPTGKIIKIVPNIDSKALPAPIASGFAPGKGDTNVVRVIAIRNVSAIQLVPMLRPLMPQWSEISAYPPSNMLILSGRAANLDRIVRIISRVDTPDANSIEIIPLHYATAQEAVKTLKALSTGGQLPTGPRINISADTRSNSVLLSGSKSLRLRYRIIISELDSPNPAGASANTQVIYLQYLECKDIVPILAGVARSQFSGEVGTVIGTRTVVKIPQAEQTVGGLGSNVVSGSQTASKTTSAAIDDGKPKVEIIGEPNTNTIILNAPPRVMRTLKSVIARLDIRPAQVMIQAIIAEVNQDDADNLGVQWGSLAPTTDDNNQLNIGFQSGFGIITQNGFQRFQVQINALAASNKANILSTPTVVVMDNHLAHIKVGKQLSVQTSAYPNAGSGGGGATPFTTFDREDAALLLNVTPQISRDGNIRLTILHQNNQAQNPNDKTGRPIFNISEITTTVIIHDRDTLVLGGLVQNQVSNTDQKLPILGDIPVLGQLFHNHSHSHEKKKLLIFLHPVILRDNEHGVHVTNAKYDDLREEQLRFLRHMRYDPETQVALPDRHPPIKLPKPFSQTASKWPSK